MTSEKMTELADKHVPQTDVVETVSLLNYFAAREPTSPPEIFMRAQFPPNPLKAKNGAPLPNSDPTAEQLAAALAKWRFLCAYAMLAESKKRSE